MEQEGPATRSSQANVRPYSRRKRAAARPQDVVGRRLGDRALGRPSSARSRRQHHARLRLSPSRCAILPSLRSLTSPERTESRARAWRHAEENVRTTRETAPDARASCTRLPSAQATGIRRRPAPTPGNRGRCRTSQRARSRISAARSGSKVSAHSSDRTSAKAVLKWVPTRIG